VDYIWWQVDRDLSKDAADISSRPARAAGSRRFRTGDRVLVVTGPDGEKRIHDAFYPRA
jgi:hypothetical protein